MKTVRDGVCRGSAVALGLALGCRHCARGLEVGVVTVGTAETVAWGWGLGGGWAWMLMKATHVGVRVGLSCGAGVVRQAGELGLQSEK